MRLVLGAAFAVVALAALPARAQAPLRFVARDLWVDAGAAPLAAYQIEITTSSGDGKIAGVEGGDGVFAPPPYYDPAALAGGRIVLAAFTLRDDAPRGRVRVATLHLQEQGGVTYRVRLVVAATAGGAVVLAAASLVERSKP